MKKHLLTTIAIGVSAISMSAYADKVQFNQLPQAVQNAVKATAGTAPIEDIDRDVRDGQTVYEVAFKRNGENTELRLNNDGKILNPEIIGGSTNIVNSVGNSRSVSARMMPLSAAHKVTLNQLPEAAQNTIKAEANGAPVEDIDMGTVNGKTFYEAAFKRTGQNTELRVDETGRVVGVNGVSTPSMRQGIRGNDRHLAALPAPVQRTFLRYSGNARISDVQKQSDNGRTAYQIQFVDNGQRKDVQIYEDGTIASVGSAPVTSQSGSSAVQPQLNSQTSGFLATVPQAVQTSFLGYAGNSTLITDVDKEHKNGKTYYNIMFKRSDGKKEKVSFNEDGTRR